MTLRCWNRRLKSALEETLGYEVVTFLRSVEDVTAIAQVQGF